MVYVNTRKIASVLPVALAWFGFNAKAHDTYEITLEVKQRRSSVVAEMEMARSTGHAALDPNPSQGILFDPADFGDYRDRFIEAAPHLLLIADSTGDLKLQHCEARLSREDDVLIEYTFAPSNESTVLIKADILNRFPPDGFGVKTTFRNNSGKWAIPILIRQDQPSAFISAHAP